LTRAEEAFVRETLEEGHDVEVVSAGAGRTPDFRVDGTPTELKTLSGVARQTPDGLSSALSSRILDARGQAATIVADARKQPGVTQEIARRGIRRAYGADNIGGARVNSITVLLRDGAVAVRRT
jgi:hypothetical protein